MVSSVQWIESVGDEYGDDGEDEYDGDDGEDGDDGDELERATLMRFGWLAHGKEEAST